MSGRNRIIDFHQESESDGENIDVLSTVKQLKKLVKPLKIFSELGHAFSGRDDPNLKLSAKHVLGGITKYIFS